MDSDDHSDRESSSDEDLSQELTEKLVHFQEITNIDDLDRCKTILRQHSWDVVNAVQSTFTETVPNNNVQNQEVLQTQAPDMELRRRHIGAIAPGPFRNFSRATYYEARRSSHYPQGVFGWSFYILTFPFRFTYSTLFTIFRFVWRIFVHDPRSRITNPLGDVRTFIREYEEKYGTRHPVFFQGTYADAQSESRKQSKYLLVYLHGSDNHDTPEFCTNTLTDIDVIQLVHRNCLFWACSVSSPEGYRVSCALRENTHPFLAMICQLQGKMTVIGRMEGPLTPQEFLGQVSGIIDRYEPLMIAARADRAERDMTQQLRSEQDEAYQQSLQLDKEKEEKKRLEGETRRKEEELILERKRQKQEENKRYLKRKEACKQALESETEASGVESLKLMIKLPDGSRLSRNFLCTQPVKCIHDFVFCQENAPRQFQIVTNFPRRIIPGCSTVEILKLEDNEREETEQTNMKIPRDETEGKLECDSGRWMTIADAGLKSSEMLFVHALDDTDDEDSDSER